MEYKKGTFGYLNELAKNKGFNRWFEYYRYLVNKKEERLIQEKEKKVQKGKLYQKKIREESFSVCKKLTGMKKNFRKGLYHMVKNIEITKIKKELRLLDREYGLRDRECSKT